MLVLVLGAVVIVATVGPDLRALAGSLPEYAIRIQAAIDKKVEQGQEIALAEAPQPAGQVIDLMEALRASLEKKPAKRAPAAAPAQPAKPARKAAAKK